MLVGRANGGIEAAVAALVDGLTRPPTAAELSGARRYIIGSFPQRASGVGGVAALLYTAWLYARPVSSWGDYLPAIGAISDETLIDTAARWIQPRSASVVAVGPRDFAQQALAQLGTPAVRSQDDRGFESAV